MFTLQVLPMRTFSVKLSVCSSIGSDSTSNAEIWSRAGGAMSAIGAVFALLLVGQPFGPGADVAAMLTAATTASDNTVTAATTRRVAIRACRNRGCQENPIGDPPPLTGRLLTHRRQAVGQGPGEEL